MPPPIQSNIWNYFEPNIEDHNKANCKICNKSYSRKGRTTSSLKNHLKSMHPEEFFTFECMSIEKQLRKVEPVAGEHRPIPRSMSNPGLTSEAQLRYIRQWFEEFSELQREDFLPVLAAAQSGQPDQLAAILTKLSCDDKPVSLFQCRIKLFNEWFPSWAENERDRLIKAVSEIDPDFGTKLQDILVNGPKVNGDAVGPDFLTAYNESREENAQNNMNEELVAAVEENVDTVGVAQENIPVEITATS